MRRLCHIFALLFATSILFADEGELLYRPAEEITSILRKTAMPEMGSARIEHILGRYYNDGLGGPEKWKRIESLHLTGTLTLESGKFDFNAYQKKPNLVKMALRQPPNPESMVLGYDGEIAWQQLSRGAAPEPMTESEARRFAHSSRFRNHLLHPFAEGKTIRYIDTVPVEGTICHQIRVNLDTDFQVDYFIDIRSYLEIKIENTDLQRGNRNSVLYKEYTKEFGMPIAKKVESLEEGEWVSTLELSEVKVNSGLMPWMFDMPN